MKHKILSEQILSDRFSKLSEFSVQFPSIRNPGDYAAPIKREVLKTSNSVVVLIYAKDDDAFVFTQEYRAGVGINADEDDAFLLQCVAGMIDRKSAPEEIARSEAMEEAGVTIDTLRLIATLYNSPGRMTEKTYLYLAEIGKAPAEGIFGLPEEGEEIRTRVIPRATVYAMMDRREILDSMAFTALSWYKANR